MRDVLVYQYLITSVGVASGIVLLGEELGVEKVIEGAVIFSGVYLARHQYKGLTLVKRWATESQLTFHRNPSLRRGGKDQPGVRQELRPRSITMGLAVLTSVCVQAVSRARPV